MGKLSHYRLHWRRSPIGERLPETGKSDTSMPIQLTPRMTADEIACFKRYLAQARIYLEFGCGGSTKIAAEAHLDKLFSIDSDKEWVKVCRGHSSIAPLVLEDRARIQWINVGPIRKWGYPASKDHVRLWPNYSLSIWKNMGDLKPDLVLIDGRWRVSTTVQSLMKCTHETVIMFHDFPLRESYRQIAPFIYPLEQVDTLLVFRRKQDLNISALWDLGFSSLLVPR